MAGSDRVRAWQPRVAGVAEVLHAEWRAHAYPAHTHGTWTLLIVDDGLIGNELAGHERAATRSGVTLLPPHVVHDGRPVTSHGFRKRVTYLDEQTLGRQYIGAACGSSADHRSCATPAGVPARPRYDPPR